MTCHTHTWQVVSDGQVMELIETERIQLFVSLSGKRSDFRRRTGNRRILKTSSSLRFVRTARSSPNSSLHTQISYFTLMHITSSWWKLSVWIVSISNCFLSQTQPAPNLCEKIVKSSWSKVVQQDQTVGGKHVWEDVWHMFSISFYEVWMCLWETELRWVIMYRSMKP